MRRIDRRTLGFCAAAAILAVSCARADSTTMTPAATPSAAVESTPPPQQPSTPPAQTGKPLANVDAQALASLQERIKDYVALHRKLESTLPNLPKETTPEQIDTHQRALARLIQDARRNAKPGDIFTKDSRGVIRGLMQRVFGGPEGAKLKASIMDENPGRLQLSVNSRYPDSVPLSTVPPMVLAGLPKLPEELEFRFIGRTLILMDVHAHIIADLIENIVP
jgi:hypothetical protein